MAFVVKVIYSIIIFIVYLTDYLNFLKIFIFNYNIKLLGEIYCHDCDIKFVLAPKHDFDIYL